MIEHRHGVRFVVALPAGEWRFSPCFADALAAVDISGQHVPMLIIDGKAYPLTATDPSHYLEFLIADGVTLDRKRMH